MQRQRIVMLLALALTSSYSYSNPITLYFSGSIIDSSSTPSWAGQPLSGHLTIYPDNFVSNFTTTTPTSTQIYSYIGPAYGISGPSIIDYAIDLPNGSTYTAPHEDVYAEWGGITVHHQYLDGPSEETYQVGLSIQPSNRSYQADFSFILENNLHNGALVSDAGISQIPNIEGATYVSAGLSVFDYGSMKSKLNVHFSIESLQATPIPEPSSGILALQGVASLAYLIKRRRLAPPIQAQS